MMLQSCYAVFATSISSSVSFHRFLAHVELEEEFCCMLEIKVRGHAKEKAKQQPATWMDFLTRKKLRQKFISFIPSHIRKTAAGFLAINKAYY